VTYESSGQLSTAASVKSGKNKARRVAALAKRGRPRKIISAFDPLLDNFNEEEEKD